jgi:tetratricopeptide (TPR) repeat protein
MRGILITLLVFLSVNVMAQDFDVALNKANSKFFEENYKDALSGYQQLRESSLGDTIQQSWVSGYIGVCFQELGQIKEAKNNYREALKKGTLESSFYSKLLAIYKSEKDVDGQEFVHLSKRKNLPYEYRKATKSLAFLYLNSKQFEKLLTVCDDLLETSPDNTKYWYFKAVAYQKLKQNDKAVIAYKKTLALDPEHLKSNMNLGLILFFRANKKYEKAVNSYDAIKKPTNADYDKCQIKLNVAIVQFREAEPFLQKAHKAKPNANIKKALYTLYKKVKEYKKAEQYQ